jgi:hypothetical protein
MKKAPARSSNPYLVLYEDAIKHASYRIKLEADQVGKSWLAGYHNLLETVEDYTWKLRDLVTPQRHQKALGRLGTLKHRLADMIQDKPVPEETKQELIIGLDVLSERPEAESFD